jgi:hypothetical protein
VKLALMLLLAVRTYYPVSIADLAAGRNSHTHIRVTGKVVLVKYEADGDLHIRLSDMPWVKLSDRKHWIVAECIPKLPCAKPKVGQTITVEGIYRRDAKHGGWAEVHPVESLAQEITLDVNPDFDAQFSTGRIALPLPRTDATTSPAFRNINTDVDNWKPEPEDVPAIQEERDVKADCNSCVGYACTAMACDPNYTKRMKVTTCADKTRILMHDEQNPPKYWCYAPHQ